MTFGRAAVAAGIVVLTAFAVVILLAGHGGTGAALVALIAIAALVAGGNLLYGRHSHGAAAQARVRPAQQAADRAADRAAASRRAVAEAARQGEQYCPIDPRPAPDQADRVEHRRPSGA